MPFSRDQVYCVLDYETFSEAPLKKVGGAEYSMHPSTEILCAAFAIGTIDTIGAAEIHTWSPLSEFHQKDFSILLRAFRDPKIILVAQNAAFEQLITRYVFGPKHMPSKRELTTIPHNRWICTATLAAALALPRKLEGACAALKLPVQKDMDGNRLILKWCKPRKPSKKNPSTRHTDPVELERIIQYCATDVRATVGLFLKCPPLSDLERKIWILDQEINFRGFLVDRTLVKTVLEMIDQEVEHLNAETFRLTGGRIATTNRRDAVLRWLEDREVFLPDLRAGTVKQAIDEGLATGDAKRILEIRQSISKTSTAKYIAFEQRSRCDSRLRDNLLYWGASTGRWAGMGVQPQNFPRGTVKDTNLACEILSTGDLDWVRTLYGNPMEVFSSCLRGMIIPGEERVLDVADYAGIEVRVLFWLAKHEEGMRAFREGRDLYRELAAYIFNIDHVENVTDKQRFVGKTATLGCGYNMGWKKFIGSCANLGQEVSEETAKTAVNAYRMMHAPVARLWNKTAMAAIAATENPGMRYTINRMVWYVKDKFLWCQLPSGRRLAFYGPQVQQDLTPWGETRSTLFHYAVNPRTRKWELDKTYGGKLVENVVQAISRDLMAEAMLRIDGVKDRPWDIILSAHDELIAERILGMIRSFNEKDFFYLMAQIPTWAEGCPVKVEGWSGPRYKK